MLRPISKFTITQVPNKAFPNRNKVFVFSHCINFKATSTWQNMADTGELIIPLKVPVLDSDTQGKVYFDGKSLVSNANTNPFFVRGDKIKVELGYIYLTEQGEKKQIETVFIGYITAIEVKEQVRFSLMDEMYIMQQTLAKKKTYKNVTLRTLLLDQIGDKYQISKSVIDAKLGDFVIDTSNGAITLAEVLQEIRDTYKIETFFRFLNDGSSILYGTGFVYYPDFRFGNRSKTPLVFAFQQNIISDNLEWQSTKDVRIKVIAKSTNIVETSKTNADGSKRTKKEILTVTVGDLEGEARTINKVGITSESELKEIANAELNKLYYEGFKGSFLTFGLPLVKWGMAIDLQNKQLKDLNGIYLVKSVDYEFGTGGYRQNISLHIKIADGDAKIY